jgi:hypothetical protein
MVIGIDTIRLYFSEHSEERWNRLERVPSSRNKSKRPFKLRSSDGTCVSEPIVAAYKRSGDINFYIRSVGGRAFYGHGSVGLSVTASIPKILYGCNSKPTTKDEVNEGFQMLQQCARDIGVNCNIYQATISRLDTFSNHQMSQPVADYMPILKHLPVPSPSMYRRDYPTSVLWSNRRQRKTFYDKNEEIRSRGVASPFNGLNIMRYERGALCAAKVRSDYAVRTVQQLLDDFDAVTSKAHALTTKDWLKFKMPDPDITPTEVQSAQSFDSMNQLDLQMSSLLNLYGAKGIDKLLAVRGWESLCEAYGEAEVVRAIGASNGDKYATTSRIKSKQKRAAFELAYAGVSASGKPLSALYQELQEKLTGEVEEENWP